jgi:beta-lactam-binding protein with PASTA domain
VTGQGAEQPTAAPPAEIVVEPGVVPDLTRQQLPAALTALDEADLTYLVVEVSEDSVPAATVFAQSPSAGTTADDQTVVTLTVAR